MDFMKKWLYFSIASFLVSSVTILLMPFASFEAEGQQAFAYTLAVVFWLGFVFGFVFLFPINTKRKRDINYSSKKSIAFLRFFSNKPALVFDISLIVGLLTLILAYFINGYPQWLTITGIFMFVFSLEMHGIFNGKNYDYFNTKQYRR